MEEESVYNGGSACCSRSKRPVDCGESEKDDFKYGNGLICYGWL